VTPALEELVNELREVDRQDRIEMLIDLANELPPIPERLAHVKDEDHRVHECQSPVFLFVDREGSRVRLYAEVPPEAPTVRGFVSLLVQGLDGATAKEILEVPNDLIQQSGMVELLGMQRVSGLSGVLRMLKTMVARAEAEAQSQAEVADAASEVDEADSEPAASPSSSSSSA